MLLHATMLAALAATLLAPAALAHPPALAVADIPPKTFCIVVIEPLDGFRQVRITVDEELSTDLKQATWEATDENDDGKVDADEAAGFQDVTMKYWANGLKMGNESLALRVGARHDGGGSTTYRAIRPVYAVTWRHLGHGFYEDAVSAHNGMDKGADVGFGDFETQQVREYGFRVTDDVQSVTLFGANEKRLEGLESNITVESRYSSDYTLEYVVVQAPAGWQVTSVVGQSYTGPFERRGPTERLDIEGFDTAAPWTIQFDRIPQNAEPASIPSATLHTTPTPGTPGPSNPAPTAIVFVLGAIVAVAVLRRRHGLP